MPGRARRMLRVVAVGMYTSILSAFHIGWRDLNVGSWIARMQPHEYTLQAPLMKAVSSVSQRKVESQPSRQQFNAGPATMQTRRNISAKPARTRWAAAQRAMKSRTSIL